LNLQNKTFTYGNYTVKTILIKSQKQLQNFV
jgi:hypothetical protein